MPTSDPRCLTIEELIAHGDGSLPPDRIAHINECTLCKGALDGLALTEPSVQKALLNGSLLPTFEAPRVAKPTTAAQRTITPRKWLVAASIAFVLGWASWQYFPKQAKEVAFETSPLAYVEQPYRRQMRSAGITTDLYGEAAQAFSMDSFALSVRLYQSAITQAPTNLLRTRGFYEIGIAQWQAGEFEEGANNLTQARMGELDYYEDATWALAQLYRQMGYLDEAHTLYLDLLSIEKSPYRPKAQQMIELINSSEGTLLD